MLHGNGSVHEWGLEHWLVGVHVGIVEGKIVRCRGGVYVYREVNGVEGGAAGKRPGWESREHAFPAGFSLEAVFGALPALELLPCPLQIEKRIRVKAVCRRSRRYRGLVLGA